MLKTASFHLLILLGATLTAVHAAELQLASVLGNHMVLQRDKPVAVWGWADASLRQSLGTLDSVKRRRTHSH